MKTMENKHVKIVFNDGRVYGYVGKKTGSGVCDLINDHEKAVIMSYAVAEKMTENIDRTDYRFVPVD